MNKRLVEKWNDTPTIRMHKAAFVVSIDHLSKEIDIDKDSLGERAYNISVPELLRRLSDHLSDNDQKALLGEFADRLDNLKCFL